MSKRARKQPEAGQVTYFVVQTYVANAKGLIAEEPKPATGHDHALRLFERYRDIRAGVVAFSRTGDPTTGDWADAVILARHGKVPAEIDLMEPYEADEWEKVA
ncbi:hypothetical protein [Bosea sp. 685]|uniref:hypothetical protein n=1 Tax=Bosea sp. 685 TaxID=3080057 RepID=UPI002892F0CA|nr:hypothetical protein [Bosea sp. 685]WNJ89129.1 hypothetical protein RMR04_22315 [Bosea sp. 685]